MNIVETGIAGLVILEPKVFGDDRGYFMESYNKKWFDSHIATTEFIQDNESKSNRGVLRGLHFQLPPFNQAKLVRVVQGEVIDVAVDLRKGSSTYGQHYSVKLSDSNKKQFFVPRGFAHGFAVLSESAIFSYKVDNTYAPDHEEGIRWDDPDLKIDWKISEDEIRLSEKDQHLQSIASFESPF